jgi:hypothetical protein
MSLNVSIDDFKSIGRLVCVSTTFTALQYLLLTFIAAFIYPGGYDYFGYNFSALGRVNAINGGLFITFPCSMFDYWDTYDSFLDNNLFIIQKNNH